MTRKLFSKTREILIDRFVRTRVKSTEATSRTDLFCYGALMMTGTKQEKASGERSVRSTMKNAEIPDRLHDSVVYYLGASTRAQIADLCKELKPHTEVRKMLEAYI